MVSAYNKRVECFVDQYDSLVQDEILKKSEDVPVRNRYSNCSVLLDVNNLTTFFTFTFTELR